MGMQNARNLTFLAGLEDIVLAARIGQFHFTFTRISSTHNAAQLRILLEFDDCRGPSAVDIHCRDILTSLKDLVQPR
jgi:hypothetical protein